jgi:hypothetical protein
LTIVDFLLLITLLIAPGMAARAAFPGLRRDESTGEALFGVVFVSALLGGWLALLLAEWDLFSLPAVWLLSLGVSFAVMVARRRFLASPMPAIRVTWPGIAAISLLAFAAWLFLRPNEYVLGGRDHGVYVNTGAAIARSGGILLTDPLLVDLLPNERQALTFFEPLLRNDQSIPRTWHPGSSVPGFYLFHFDSPIVSPHGFHLYPVWFAVLTATAGIHFSLFLTPALAVLSLAAMMLTLRRSLGARVALLAAALLAVNLAQLWYARTPSAESLVQFLFWAGLWAWVRAVQTEQPIFGLLGGVAWGQIHLAKIDYVALPAVLLGWLTWAWWTGRYRTYHAAGLMGYGVMAVHALLHGALIAPSYFYDIVGAFAPASFVEQLSTVAANSGGPLDLAARLLTRNVGWIALLGVIGVSVWWMIRRSRDRAAAVWMNFGRSRWGWPAFALAVMGLSVYAYLGPSTSPLGTTTFVELSWYLGALAMALGSIGLARRMGQADAVQGLVLWSIIGLSAVLLVGGSFTFPDHFWAVRRFVPVVIPGFLILASDVTVSLLPRSLVDWRQALVPTVLAGGMFLGAYEATAPYVFFVENRGALDEIMSLERGFEPNAVLLFDRDTPGSQVGTPLKWILNRSVAYLDADASPADAAAAIAGWLAAERPVYYLASADHPKQLPDFSLDYLRTEVISWPAAEQTLTYRPTRSGELSYAFDVYQVVPHEPIEDRVLTIDVGTEASRALVAGVHDELPIPGLSNAQWTTASARFTFAAQGRPRKLLIRMGNVPALVSSEVAVWVDGALLGTIAPEPARMAVYTIRFSENAAPLDIASVELRMQTWRPSALGINADRRDLGIYVDWVKLVVKRP